MKLKPYTKTDIRKHDRKKRSSKEYIIKNDHEQHGLHVSKMIV